MVDEPPNAVLLVAFLLPTGVTSVIGLQLSSDALVIADIVASPDILASFDVLVRSLYSPGV